ncbi:hypothetical protein HYT23_00420 [Candidatus Pacearchaeota archaeon]|nr:hypothetical protein [Candidatus Pacearchaeota archaeon]
MNIGELIVEKRLVNVDNLNGRVYRIGDSRYCVKIRKGLNNFKEYNDRKLKHEFDVAEELYHAGVSVPKPEGVIGIRDPETSNFYPGFVMEYVNGIDLHKISDKSLFKIIFRLKDKEMELVKLLGFIPDDGYYLSNSIWCPEGKKVYLIDFEHWKRK